MLVNPVKSEQRLIYQNLSAYFSLISGQTKPFARGLMTNCSCAFALCNAVFCNEISAKIDEDVLTEAKAYYQSQHLPFTYWTVSDEKPHCNSQYVKHQAPSFAGMFYEMSEHVIDDEKDTRINFKRVSQPSEMRTFCEIINTCFEFDEVMANFYHHAMTRLLSHPQFEHYLVYNGKNAIGTGSIFMQGKVCGFYNLGVLPEYRQRGIGQKIQQFRLCQAQNLGAEQVVLQASSMAEQMNKTVGFETVMHLVPYLF